MGDEYHPNEQTPNQTGPTTQTESRGENAPGPALDPVYNSGYKESGPDNTNERSDTVNFPSVTDDKKEDSSQKDSGLSDSDKKELEALRAEKAMRASQTNPDGLNYQQTDPNQTGTVVEAPDPVTIGYHPHEGDHSVDPFTGTVKQA